MKLLLIILFITPLYAQEITLSFYNDAKKYQYFVNGAIHYNGSQNPLASKNFSFLYPRCQTDISVMPGHLIALNISWHIATDSIQQEFWILEATSNPETDFYTIPISYLLYLSDNETQRQGLNKPYKFNFNQNQLPGIISASFHRPSIYISTESTLSVNDEEALPTTSLPDTAQPKIIPKKQRATWELNSVPRRKNRSEDLMKILIHEIAKNSLSAPAMPKIPPFKEFRPVHDDTTL